MKKCIVFTFIIVIFAVFSDFQKLNLYNKCYAEDVEEELGNVVLEELNKIDFDALDEYFIDAGVSSNIFNGMSVKEIAEAIVKGEISADITSIFNYCLMLIKHNISQYFSLLLVILVIILLCFMFNKIKSGVEQKTVEEIIHFVCFSVIITLIVKLSSGIIEDSANAIFSMQKQMNIVFPILLTLMTSVGAVGSVAAFTPLVAFLSNLISNLFSYCLLPLFSLTFVLSIVNHLSTTVKFDKMLSFLNSLFKWIVGVVFSVFFIFFSIQGIAVSTSDGLSLKAAQFAVKNYVPLLGGYVSEGFQVVKAGMLLVRNSVGIVGIIVMLSSVLAPILAIAVFSLSLKFIAAILEPLGDNSSVSILSSVGSSFKLLLTCLLTVLFMYIVTVILIMCSVSGVV